MNSGANLPAQAQNRGPMETAIAALWGLVWEAMRNGEVTDVLRSNVEKAVAGFRADAAQYTPPQKADLAAAEHFHAVQSAQFAAYTDDLAMMRSIYKWMLEKAVATGLSIEQHVARSLTLANGAVVLGTLAFIGNAHSPKQQAALTL